MNILHALVAEFENEARSTTLMLERIPASLFDWQPHQKSMSLKALATHLAEIPHWVNLSIETDVLDFAVTPYAPPAVNSVADLLKLHETSVQSGLKALKNTSEQVLDEEWRMQNGEYLIAKMSKYESVRHCYCQTTHHRAQLGVYLRLLDIPIPGVYGPSADDQEAPSM
jgi:uncharacterized damage-inducible protein DinB